MDKSTALTSNQSDEAGYVTTIVDKKNNNKVDRNVKNVKIIKIRITKKISQGKKKVTASHKTNKTHRKMSISTIMESEINFF